VKFQKGHKLAKGGKRNPPGGRPSKRKLEIHKEAGVIAREFIESHVDPILKTYLGLAAGRVVKTRKGKFRLLVDPPTTRHAVDKLLPELDASKIQRPIAIQIQKRPP